MASQMPSAGDDVGRAAPDAQPPDRHERRRSRARSRSPSAGQRDLLGVGDRDHEQRDQVVDDDEREQEHAQAVRAARADEREHPERERRVGRHRDAPAVRRVAAGVEREVDAAIGDRHPAERGEHRQRDAAALAQLAHVELAPRLQADDEEEEHHQAVVDPVAQVLGERVAADADRELGPPHGCGRSPGRCSPRRGRRSPRPAAPSRRRSRCAGSRAPGRRGGAPRPSGPRTARSSARNCELPCAAELDDVAVGQASRCARRPSPQAGQRSTTPAPTVGAVGADARCGRRSGCSPRSAVVISLAERLARAGRRARCRRATAACRSSQLPSVRSARCGSRAGRARARRAGRRRARRRPVGPQTKTRGRSRRRPGRPPRACRRRSRRSKPVQPSGRLARERVRAPSTAARARRARRGRGGPPQRARGDEQPRVDVAAACAAWWRSIAISGTSPEPPATSSSGPPSCTSPGEVAADRPAQLELVARAQLARRGRARPRRRRSARPSAPALGSSGAEAIE